jgi:hypothetical protein
VSKKTIDHFFKKSSGSSAKKSTGSLTMGGSKEKDFEKDKESSKDRDPDNCSSSVSLGATTAMNFPPNELVTSADVSANVCSAVASSTVAEIALDQSGDGPKLSPFVVLTGGGSLKAKTGGASSVSLSQHQTLINDLRKQIDTLRPAKEQAELKVRAWTYLIIYGICGFDLFCIVVVVSTAGTRCKGGY